MNKDRVLMVIVFGTLALLNMKGHIEINERAVFGLTLGALIICISTCFDFPITSKEEGERNLMNIIKIYRYKIIQTIIYSIGFITMFIVIFIKPNPIINEFMNKFNSNTLMLLSIAVTFLSISVSNAATGTLRNSIRKHYLDLFEERIDNINESIDKRGDTDEQ